MLSTIQKTFVFLHGRKHNILATLRTIYNEEIMNMKILHTFRLNRDKVAPLVIAGTAPPRYPCQNDSSLGISLYHPHLSGYRHTPLSRLRIFSFCRRRYFHRSQHRLGYPLSHLRDRIEKEACQAIFLARREAVIREEVVFGRVAEYLLWVYAWFYIAWGLNYSQPNIYDRIGMKPVEVSEAKFKAFAYQYADSLNALSISLIAEE